MAFLLLALLAAGFFAAIILLPWDGIKTILALVWAGMALSAVWAMLSGFF